LIREKREAPSPEALIGDIVGANVTSISLMLIWKFKGDSINSSEIVE
jgi:hypothetical protein